MDDIAWEYGLGEKPKVATILKALATDLPSRWYIDDEGHSPLLVFYQHTEKLLSFSVEVGCAPVRTSPEGVGSWGFGFRSELILLLGKGGNQSRQTAVTGGSMNFDEALDPLRQELKEIGEGILSTSDRF